MIKSGELVTIKDSAYDGMNSLTIHGNTRQNLWVNIGSKTNHGITVTTNEDGSITISGTSGESYGSVLVSSAVYSLKPNTAYTVSVDKAVSGLSGANGFYVRTNYESGSKANFVGSGKTKTTFMTESNMNYVDMGFQTSAQSTLSGTYRVMLREATPEEVQALASMPVTIPEGGTEDIPQDYPMLLASGDDFDWCPPGLNSVGDSGSVEVVTAGKNLVTGNFTISRNISITGGHLYLASDKNAASAFIRVCGGETYTASFFHGGITTIACYGSADETFYLGGSSWNNSGKNDQTYKVPEITRCVRIGLLSDNGITSNALETVQLELGSIATSYEQARTKQTAIDLKGHKLCSLPDGTRDELRIDRNGRVTLVNRCYIGTLDSSLLEWDSTAGFAYFEAPDGCTQVICDKLPTADSLDATTGAYFTQGRVYIAVNGVIDDLDSAKTWVDSNDPVFILDMEEQTIDLGTVDLPALRKLLVNNIWVADDTPATIDVDYNRYRSGCDGFRVDGKHNYWDMRACLASRDAGVPEKKLSTVTVPYMSGFYDLSKLYGSVSFESREVSYTMEFVEDTTEELQRRKSDMLQWLAMVHDADIYDDDYPGYHFHGSYSESEWEEDESGHQGSLTVTFLCQPFLIADDDTSVSVASGEHTVTVEGQPVNAYASCASGSATIKFRGVQQSVSTTPVRLAAQLQPGDNDVTVSGSTVTLVWKERHV